MICQAPLLPPRNVVNMGHRSVEPGQVQASSALFGVRIGKTTKAGPVNSGEKPINLRF
jgi:hypothetical protein